MSVAVSGNTIHRIVVVLLTVTAARQTGLAAPRAEIRCRTGSELRKETLADKAEISGVTIELAIAAVLAIAVASVIAAIVVALVTGAALAIAVV
jgi:hypothetical protein